MHLTSKNYDIKLYLEPVEGTIAAKDMPIWKAKASSSHPSGIEYTKINYVTKVLFNHLEKCLFLNMKLMTCRLMKHQVESCIKIFKTWVPFLYQSMDTTIPYL